MRSDYAVTRDGARLFYTLDDFTDGWRQPATIVCLHGSAESTEAWRGWVPHLARDFRVLRFDIRGFGQSEPVTAGHQWSIDQLVTDLDDLLSGLGISEIGLVGCKSGGTIAMGYASRRPSVVKALAVLGSHPYGPEETWLPFIEQNGVRRWLEETMPRRLASLSPEGREWWVELMARTPLATLQGYLRWFPTVDLRDEITGIRAPTLIVSGGKIPNRASGGSDWQASIPGSVLEVLPVQSSHVGGAYPDLCAKLVRDFMAAKLDAASGGDAA